MNKRITKKVFVTSIVFFIVAAVATCVLSRKEAIALYAHSAQLDISYDICDPVSYVNSNNIGDGENEKWYELLFNQRMFHISHSSETTEIKYYISETSTDGISTSWNDITDSTRREYVKNAFASSICKWNNVFFYKQEGSNIISKYKIVNVSEGTSSNHNLVIYPESDLIMNGYFALTGPTSSPVLIDFDYLNEHYHCSDWRIRLRLSDHLTYSSTSEFVLDMVGAHELGHVLGLKDVDAYEEYYQGRIHHHEEILMGYSSGGVTTRQPNITYKDLAGVAITRGFHTDNDHQWIFHSYSNNEYKLICSICNGVKYVSSLDGISYVNYKDCNDEHDLEDGNMFAVASYGNNDYYKCKYCRYVAPFTAIEEQDYDYDEYNNDQHIVTNQVQGLEYSFYEDHTFDVTHTCILCGFQCSHAYTHHYENYSYTLHKAYCECGTYDLAPHAADIMNSYFSNGHIYAPCLYCNTLIDLGGNGPIVPGQGFNGQMVTDNGSYIMSNGIYVIVEEDLESYLNGTLVFHHYGQIVE